MNCALRQYSARLGFAFPARIVRLGIDECLSGGCKHLGLAVRKLREPR